MTAATLPRTHWFKIKALAGGSTEAYIYDEIGLFGVTADDFIAQIRGITTSAIELHINSPGGYVFDGISIMNALVNHRATVDVVVDGLAASAASVVAMAGNTITMNPGSRMMIHEPWAMCSGPATDMTTTAGELDAVGADLAKLYAAKAGGTPAKWRAAMCANNGDGTSYSAEEAVSAGLATKVGRSVPAADIPRNTWDMKIYNRAGARTATRRQFTNAEARVIGETVKNAFSQERLRDAQMAAAVRAALLAAFSSGGNAR